MSRGDIKGVLLPSNSMPEAILFANHDYSTFVLDIPSSIASGQGAGHICSSRLVEAPFVTPEPKGKKRETFLARLPSEHVEYHRTIEAGVQKAFQCAACAGVQAWSSQRVNIKSALTTHFNFPTGRLVELPVVLSSVQNDFAIFSDIQNRLVYNQTVQRVEIVFNDATHLLIPAACTFIWSSITCGLHILQDLESQMSCPVAFDMILLDPPWANRSVRNTRGYVTREQQVDDPIRHALDIVRRFHSLNGYVAFWITNKPAIRTDVLKSMADSNFTLTEEWIWVKTTTNGEPVSPINGVWRKPYEILLLFQHKKHQGVPGRRFMLAVPDLHSRKPNLRALFDMFFQPRHVLELFARNLTPGWWCLGDEVVKFQDKALWCENRLDEHATANPLQMCSRNALPSMV